MTASIQSEPSVAQEWLWLVNQANRLDPSYNVAWRFAIEGSLDVKALNQSLKEVVRRHEILTATFSVVKGRLLQGVRPENVETTLVPATDLRGLGTTEEIMEIANRMSKEEAGAVFDLQSGPLIRSRVFQLDDLKFQFVLTLHHMITDGWSMAVLFNELKSLYEEFSQGRKPELPDLPIQYADYAAWQREWMMSDSLQTQLDYWRQKLANCPAGSGFPTDRPRRVRSPFAMASREFSLSSSLLSRVLELCERDRVTLFMVLLAALKVLIHRYTGQDDISVVSPVAGRNEPELEGLIGLFINPLALRTDLSGNPSFRNLLGRIREVCLDGYANQDVPFVKVIEALQSNSPNEPSPMLQSLLVLNNTPEPSLTLEGLQIQRLPASSGAMQFETAMSIMQVEGHLLGRLDYAADLFDDETAEALTDQFQTLLESACSDPDLKLSSLALQTSAQRNRIVHVWNKTTEHNSEHFIHELFETEARRAPRKTAVRSESEEMTYAELDHCANQLGNYLSRLGVGTESRVAVSLDRSIELVTAFLGVLKAGGAYVPLDPAYPSERLRFMLRDAGAAVLITHSDHLERFAGESSAAVCIDRDESLISAESPNPPPTPGLTPQNLAYVIYTSGSTGQPNGVMVPHANVIRLLSATEHLFQFDENDVWALFHSSSFDFSVWEMWGALLSGGQVVVVSHETARSPHDLLDLLKLEGITVLNQTPSAFWQLDRADEEFGTRELSLRVVIFGGERLDLDLPERWAMRRGSKNPRLANMYGITETTVHVTYGDLNPPWEGRVGSPIGARIDDLRLYVLDEDMEPVPVRVPGQLFVGGEGLARGYLNRPGLTAERFVPDALSGKPGARLYRTGDLVRWRTSGELEFLGRIDHQVKVRGYRIEPKEVEAAIMSFPGLNEAVVQAHLDASGSARLVAYVVRTDIDVPAPDATQIRTLLNERLPEYMIPSTFVFLTEMPITSNGKLDRSALRLPDVLSPPLASTYEKARDSIEATLTSIWAEVLGVERVGIHDDFLELGGHSLSAVQIASRVRNLLGAELPVSAIFEHPTIAELGLLIHSEHLDGT